MISLASLWLPILLAALAVFVASSVIHMFMPYHRNDVGGVPREDDFLAAIRPFDLASGDYMVPHAHGDHEVMKSPDFRAKVEEGPVLFMTVMPRGNPFGMGAQMAQWFTYCLVVVAFAAFVASSAVPAGGDYLTVFHFVGATAFAGFALGLPQRSIWYRLSWSTTAKSMFDGLVYAALAAGIFGWLWPA